MKLSKSKGFTLVEVSAAVTLLVLALGLAIAGYMFSLRNINQADIQEDLDIDVQVAMESLKKDLRLSSLDKMFYYPEGSGPYEAVSFPIAYDSDGDQLLEKNDEMQIIWDETIIYHIRPTTPHQLVKTVFKPRDNSLTDAQRQAQINAVVKDGHGGNTYNGINATSKVIFENLLNWKLNPKAGQFDGYASEIHRDRASMGYILMGPGDHKVKFKVIGKNKSSSGYKIGIDQLFASSSQSPREAEAQTISSETGASAVSEYQPNGSWKGNHHLTFPATAIGNSFTLTIPNDKWEETNFNGTGYLVEDARIEFDETLSPSDFIVQLDGMGDTWTAEDQTGSEPQDSPAGLMANWIVRVMQKGSELADNGNWLKYNSRKCRLKFDASSTAPFRITNVFIGETTSTTNSSLNFNTSTIMPVTFGGATASPTALAGGSFTSDWVDFPIDKGKNYLVSYRIVNNAAICHPAIWLDNRGSVASSCMVVTNGSVATAKDATWSNRSGIDPMEMKGIIGLASIESNYPEKGTYTSPIIDTHLDSPPFGDFSWNAKVPIGAGLEFKVRTGNNSDLSDAPDWTTLSSFSTPSAIAASYKRYIQFQALLTSDTEGMRSPKLKDVSIDWTAAKQLVDVGGIFTKGPDFGIFEVSVDGDLLRSALIIELEIFKDTLGMNDETQRITSSLKVELTPRNSGM